MRVRVNIEVQYILLVYRGRYQIELYVRLIQTYLIFRQVSQCRRRELIPLEPHIRV